MRSRTSILADSCRLMADGSSCLARLFVWRGLAAPLAVLAQLDAFPRVRLVL